jgi:hypothetical protein
LKEKDGALGLFEMDGEGGELELALGEEELEVLEFYLAGGITVLRLVLLAGLRF